MGTITHDSDTELLSVRRASRRLGLHRATTYNLIRRGVIPAMRVGGSIRLDPRELDAWLAEQRTGRSDR